MLCRFLSSTPVVLAIALTLLAQSSAAQVTSDGSLPTAVTQTGLSYTITGGASNGVNLFHSLSQFSVPSGGAAIFNNAADVQNILTRVTGGSISNIDGLLQTNGAANLFLINPAGIQFGSNARLRLGGSFIGSTARGIKFADGFEFKAVNRPEPLLTISIPTGLQFGAAPGAIQIQGTGHLLATADPTFAPEVQTGIHPGLAVPLGKTLALVGGPIDLRGGVLTAPGGRVELGSVNQGSVSLTPVPAGFQLGYAGVQNFDDIDLRNRSLADASGSIAGAIQVQGRQILLEGGSQLWIQNRGLQPSGTLNVLATESLTLIGTSADHRIRSGLITDVLGPGLGSDISVSAPKLLVQAGAAISPRTFSGARSGNLTIQATQIEVSGFDPKVPSIFSAVSSLTGRTGRAGETAVVTQQLFLLEGGFLGSGSTGSGAGGNVVVSADAVVVQGTTPSLISSNLATASLGAGNAGSLSLTTRTLAVRNSGLVVASSLGTGAAGTLIVRASESIEVTGQVSDRAYASTIGSVASLPNSGLSQLGVNTATGGTSGDVIVTTPRLRVSDRGTISASNKQSDNAGTLKVNATSILLDQQGAIRVTTLRGEGGNIDIQAQILQLRHGSYISATALGGGNGGNILVNAPIILGAENSDIIANAFQGKGGNIQIITEGIFGLQFRPQLTPRSDITASSEFGVTGTVQVNRVGIDPNAGLVELPVDLTDASQQITAGCAGVRGNQFMITGRGGLSENPMQAVKGDRPWADLRDLTTFRSPPSDRSPGRSPQAFTEATAWQRNVRGETELVVIGPRDRITTAAQPTCGIRASQN